MDKTNELVIGKTYRLKGNSGQQVIPLAKLKWDRYLFLVPTNQNTPFVTWSVGKVEDPYIDCCSGSYYKDLTKATLELPLPKPEIYGISVMMNLRQRQGLDAKDDSKDNFIMKNFSPREAFEEALEWEGIIGYLYTILEFIDDVTGLNLQDRL